MTPPQKPLSDTDEKLQAVAEEAAEAAFRKATHQTPVPTERDAMENMILQHEKECREQGPVHELRADVAALKGWVKGVGIAIMILQLLNAYGQFATKVGQMPIPTAARAESK